LASLALVLVLVLVVLFYFYFLSATWPTIDYRLSCFRLQTSDSAPRTAREPLAHVQRYTRALIQFWLRRNGFTPSKGVVYTKGAFRGRKG
jgi:hypothetical protein